MADRQVAVAERRPTQVLVVAKPALAPGTLARHFDESLALGEVTDQLAKCERRDEQERQVQLQLRREIAGQHDLLAIGQAGGIRKVAPQTRLREIAVPREVKTPDGWQEMPIAAFEVQAYAEVGVDA